MKYKPLGRNIIIEKVSDEVKSKSGLILMTKNDSLQVNDLGRVIAVSDDINEVNEGNIVIYAKYAGSTLKENDREYLIIDIDDILAVKED